MMLQKLPMSEELIRHTFKLHLRNHKLFDKIPDDELGRVSVFIETPCDCEENLLIVCVICNEALMKKVVTDSCPCYED